MIKHNSHLLERLYSAICACLLLVYSFAGFQTVRATHPEVDIPAETAPVIEVLIPKPPRPVVMRPSVPSEETKPVETPETGTEVIEPTVPSEPSVEYFDIPLSEDLQSYIFKLCEDSSIDPAIIVSMIFRESSYNAGIVGDSGISLGLMQIQPRWFQQRMSELGITNCGESCTHETCLLNPYQNVLLGIDYVAELMSTGKSIEWVLMAYNGGPAYADGKAAAGEITKYVTNVLEYSWSLRGA